MKELLMGNEAIAAGALAAGVQVVAGYPGTPSSEVLETIAKRNPGTVHVEWSVNEKAGAEVAVGAAYTGVRAMVTMKQMGLNVASDPIMCVNYIGVKGGLVIYVADDPGPISSQTEQDTRHFGKYARIPVFDCDSPEQAFQAVQDAFLFSETHHTPVFLRSTTRVCHACADIDVPELRPPAPAEGFVKDSKWVIFPGLSFKNKQKLVRREQEFSRLLSDYPGNTLEGSGQIGIACGGISYAYVKEALSMISGPQPAEDRYRILKIATPYPFPNELADRFLTDVRQVICFEELDPVIEDALIYRLGSLQSARESAAASRPGDSTTTSGSFPQILGKHSGTVPAAGELSPEIAAEILGELTTISGHSDHSTDPAADHSAGSAGSSNGSVSDSIGNGDSATNESPASDQASPVPDLPVRPPVLCAGCPHRGSFYAVKKAVAKVLGKDGLNFDQAVYHGDIGCYTLGNAAPLNMVDTCLCMGAGITMAQGMSHVNGKTGRNTLNFAFAGDSTFFASGITGAVNAVYNQADMILCILDNSTTAMTGHQPHPGMGITMMGERVKPVDIHKVLEGIGVPWIRTVDPLDHRSSVDTVIEAMKQKGVRAIIFKSPCIALMKSDRFCRVDAEQCVGCMRCINEIGCPALAPAAGSNATKKKAVIDPALCNGCGLCAQLCPVGSIKAGSPEAASAGSGKEDLK